MSVLLSTIVCELVDDTKAVSVATVRSGGTRTVLQVRCAEGDIAKLIGKQGRTARALRTLLLGFAQSGEYDLDILETR